MIAVRILVIDNYDSFVFNLVQYLGQLGADCDVRRNDDDGGIRVVNLKTVVERTTLPVRAGDFFVPLDQPLANVAVAALEPDTQSSYAANYALTFPGPRDPDRYVRVARVMSPLSTSMTPWGSR